MPVTTLRNTAHRTRRKPARRGRPEIPSTAEERQTRFVDAAIRVIARDGLAGTSTRAVAATAGVSQAMLHYSFPGKHALLLAVLESIHKGIRELLSASTADASSLPAAVTQMARGFWAFVLTTPDLQRVQYELTLYALTTPDSADLARLQYEGYVDALASALTQAHGQSLPAKAARNFAGVCVATMDGLILQHLACGDTAASKARLELAITALQSLCKDLA